MVSEENCRFGQRRTRQPCFAISKADNRRILAESLGELDLPLFFNRNFDLFIAGTDIQDERDPLDLSSSLDNGRLVGYDNAHGQHHRHYFGRVDCVEFESYEKLESEFEAQVRQYLETATC
jgi:hypothetical protein